MKKLFIILLLIFCGSCSSNNFHFRHQIKQQVHSEINLIVKDAVIFDTKFEKVNSQSNSLKTVYKYSFFVSNRDRSMIIFQPWRIFYLIQCDNLTGKIKVLDRVIYSQEQ